MSTNPLRRAADRTAAEADRLSAAFGRQVSRVLREADSRVRDWLRDHRGRKVSPRMRRQVREALRVAGFDALAEAATAGPFDEIEARMLAARATVGGVLADSQAARARLEALRLWHLDDLLDEGTVLTRVIGDVLVRGQGGAARRLPQELDKVLQHADARLQTLYDTALSIYGRQVEAEHAGDDATTVFAYMGPVDQKTRDFCLDHVGKVYMRSEIDALDNGQLSNVFLTGGGYNCRHVWHEVSNFSELQDLQGTDQRAPEIQEAVDEVMVAA